MEDRRGALLAVVALLVVVLLCGGVSWFLVSYDLADEVRDFLIILLAIQSMVVGAFLLLMLWQLYQLIKLLREEIVPLLHVTKDTVEQVKHTTTFVGQSVAAPVISLRGFGSGVKEMVDTLRGKKEPHELLRRDTYDG